MYFVYVLRCVDSSLYCGYTIDVAHRIKAHTGKARGGAKYTKSHPPVSVEAVWKCPEKGLALALEKLFKNLTKQDKERLVSNEVSLADLFGDKLGSGQIERDHSFERNIEAEPEVYEGAGRINERSEKPI